MNQCDILKRAFNRGERLTVLSALKRYGVMALSQRCGDLQCDGYSLRKDWKDLPNGKRVRLYSKGRA